MTLEMRDRVNREHGKIYGIISVCRERNLSEENIIKILQDQVKRCSLSERMKNRDWII